MEINIFVNQLDGIIKEIEEKVNKIESNTNTGIKAMPELIQKIQAVLPDWFYFIDQTGIGEKQIILDILTDIVTAMNERDGILLVDALVFGMQALMTEYVSIIKEALV